MNPILFLEKLKFVRSVNYHCFSPKLFPISKRDLWLSRSNMEEAVEKLEKNPYYKKYEMKIEKLHKTNPKLFVKRAENVVENIHNEKGGHSFSQPADKGKTELPKGAYAFAPRKRLDSIMKVELLDDKTPKEVEFIWTTHFSKKDAISGIMPFELFHKIQERAFKYHTFVFPLPRDQGYEFILAQFAANEIHFTPLINYQTHHENAPECLTMVHFTELAKEKGIVLMYGEFNKKIANTHDAQFLANEVQLYYGGDDAEKLALMERFHTTPDQFNHMDLVVQLEKLDLSVLTKGNKKKS